MPRKSTVSAVLTDTYLVARSGNSKTGPIPVTYRAMTTCPTSCPFLPTGPTGGCYGAGRIFGLANRNATSITEAEAVAKLLAGTPMGAKYLRDRVVGDVVNSLGKFDRAYLLTIARVAKAVGIVAFGYTHAWRLMTRADIKAVADAGYVLNASCETEADIRKAVDLGMPVVVAGDSWEEGQMVAGRRIVTCPNTTRGITCSECGLCAKPDRTAIVRFKIHGATRRKARNTVKALRARETTPIAA